jgi:hypothetical protein
LNDKIYYVYLHCDPVSNEIVYVGKGCYGRAWDVTRNRVGHPEHLAWLKQLSAKGYLPSDWVEIISKNLSEAEAFSLEKQTLHMVGTRRFNRQSGERNYQSKLTDKQACEIFIRDEPHKKLAEEFGVSRSAISMIKSRKQWRAATACLV